MSDVSTHLLCLFSVLRNLTSELDPSVKHKLSGHNDNEILFTPDVMVVPPGLDVRYLSL